MAKKCDNKSVGVLIENNENGILLGEREKVPYGWAPPAGHVDEDGEDFEAAGIRETEEEVKLEILKLKKILDQKLDNSCSRDGGDWHRWQVFEALEWSGELKPGDKMKQVKWFSRSEIGALSERTEAYLRGKISEEEWQASPGLEVVWYEIFKILGII